MFENGENLVCPKHGIKWDTNGTCAEIEEKSNVPESASQIQMFHYLNTKMFIHFIISLKRLFFLKIISLITHQMI